MFLSFGDFFTAIKEARFGFGELWQSIVDLYYSITQNSDIKVIWTALMSFLGPVMPAIPYIIIAFLLVVAFFGKRMLPVLKFLTFLVVGFVLGVYFVPPLLVDIAAIPGWVSGIIIGLLAAILYRFIYVVLFAVSGLYSVYIVCYKGFFLNDAVAEYSLDKAIVSLVIAAVAVALAFILLKYVEMLGTAALAGFLAAMTLKSLIFDYSTLDFLGGNGWIGTLVIVLLVALPGAFFQIKKRKRY